MAKKNKKTSSKQNGKVEEGSNQVADECIVPAEAVTTDVSNEGEAEEAVELNEVQPPPKAPSGTLQEPGGQDHQLLLEKLANAEAEIKSLRAQLAAKDEEIASLKDQKPAVPRFDKSKLEDMQKLQERMLQLKREQAEADAARDNAWKQLKGVVSEIAKLSTMEKFQVGSKAVAGTAAS